MFLHLNFLRAHHNKGTALVQCLKYMNARGYDIKKENVIAFGDGENDWH